MRGSPKILAALLLAASLAGCYRDPNYYGQRPYGGGGGYSGAYGSGNGYDNGYGSDYGSGYGNGGGYGNGDGYGNGGGYGTPPCQPVQAMISVNGQRQPAYGRACQQPDGTWKIVP